MEHESLPNYLKAHRKRSHLTQDDVALLLGHTNPRSVGDHERRASLPKLRILCAYEVIYGSPLRALFRGEYESVRSSIMARIPGVIRYIERRPRAPLKTERMTHLSSLLASSDDDE